jgi:hypothetical protein
MSNEDRGAYTIPEFCNRYRISTAFFFKLQAQGKGPRMMEVGRRKLVSRQADADWCREREEAAAQTAGAEGAREEVA